MAMREIKAAERLKRSTVIVMTCGHSRALGGHTYTNGKPVPPPEQLIGTFHNCQEGLCLEYRQ